MKQTADVVIVGAGVIGCSIAWHLATLGMRDIVVVEKLPAAGRGSTSAANGGIRAQWSSEINIRLSLYSIEAYQRFASETRGDCGLLQAGYLFLTASAEGEASLRQNFDLQQRLGVPNVWLDRGGIDRLAPYVYSGDLRAGTFSQQDGFIDPHGCVQGYIEAARRLGVALLTDLEVLEVRRHGGRVTGIRTASGEIATRTVVNAAGPHAGELAGRAGVSVPVHPVKRMLACTERVEGAPPMIPMTVDLDTGLLIRREGEGILLAYSNPDDPPGFDTTFDPGFIETVAEKAARRFPFVVEAEISPRRCWAGLYPESPDHNAILGECPELEGFFLAAGFGGHGLMHAPASGRALAEMIAFGECRFLDVSPLRPQRFGEDGLAAETAVL